MLQKLDLRENIRQLGSLKYIDKKNVSKNCYCLVINTIHHTICFLSIVYFVAGLTNWPINEIVTNRIHFYFLLSTNKSSYTFSNFFPNNLKEETISLFWFILYKNNLKHSNFQLFTEDQWYTYNLYVLSYTYFFFPNKSNCISGWNLIPLDTKNAKYQSRFSMNYRSRRLNI